MRTNIVTRLAPVMLAASFLGGCRSKTGLEVVRINIPETPTSSGAAKCIPIVPPPPLIDGKNAVFVKSEALPDKISVTTKNPGYPNANQSEYLTYTFTNIRVHNAGRLEECSFQSPEALAQGLSSECLSINNIKEEYRAGLVGRFYLRASLLVD